MAERRKETPPARDALAEFQGYLKIDLHDLDRCLMEQPESYHHVALGCVHAMARRDQIKMELEELTAKLDQETRARAARDEEKLTETALQNRLRQLPAMQQKNTELLEARLKADEWGALKEAFQQRSFMLREIVAKQIAERHDLNMERGAGQVQRAARDNQSERVREETGRMRRERRGDQE